MLGNYHHYLIQNIFITLKGNSMSLSRFCPFPSSSPWKPPTLGKGNRNILASLDTIGQGTVADR